MIGADVGVTRSPRVLLVTDHLGVGGLERIVVELAKGLIERGVVVGVLADAGGALWREVPAACRRHAGRPVTGPRRHLVRLLRLRAALRSGRYDLVHAHQRGVALLARMLTYGSGIRVVEHVHNTFPATPLGRLLSFRGHLLIACGSAVVAMLIDDFGRSAERVRLVQNGVADHGPAPSRQIGDAGPKTVLGAGRLVPQKDPLRFVRVLDAARRLAPGALRGVWVGDGPLRAAVEMEIANRELTGVVELAGAQHGIGDALTNSDVLLLTSAFEGLPLVALESLAAGRPVVLPDLGSCRDAVGEPPAGLLYDPAASDDDIARALLDEVAGPDYAAHVTAARSRFERLFTVDRMIGGVLDVYEQTSNRFAGLSRIRVVPQ